MTTEAEKRLRKSIPLVRHSYVDGVFAEELAGNIAAVLSELDRLRSLPTDRATVERVVAWLRRAAGPQMRPDTTVLRHKTLFELANAIEAEFLGGQTP